MRKRYLSLLLAAVVGISQLTVLQETAYAEEESVQIEEEGVELTEEEAEAAGWRYESLEDGTLTISRYVGADTELVIPKTIGGKQVAQIGGAFQYGYELTSVVIPEGVTVIGDFAFQYCSKLSSVVIPKGVTVIGRGAFDSCYSLTEIILPEDLKQVEMQAFANCESLKYITIPENVENIGEDVFWYCDSMTEITVASDNTHYESSDGILYNKGMTELLRCPAGREGEINIPDGVEKIGEDAFGACRKLVGVTIPASVVNIDSAAFLSCYNLTDVTFSEGLKKLGNQVFTGCASLNEITIPQSVTEIGIGTFEDCINLEEIAVVSGNAVYESEGGILYNTGKTELLCCPGGKTGSVADIPESVSVVREKAFMGCNKVTEILIPGSVKEIEEEAFRMCGGLECVTLSEGLERIGNGIFLECSKLKNILIPASVTEIGPSIFSGCDSLSEIQVDPANPNYESYDGILYNAGRTESISCPGGKTGEVNIPEGVQKIGDGTFWDCPNLESVSIPKGVTYIGEQAFCGSGLKSVIIPDGTIYLGGSAFSGCNNLKSITIPGSVESIGWYTISHCTALEEVVIGHGVKKIDGHALEGCSTLKELSIPGSVYDMGDDIFQGCSDELSLTVVTGSKGEEYAKYYNIQHESVEGEVWYPPVDDGDNEDDSNGGNDNEDSGDDNENDGQGKDNISCSHSYSEKAVVSPTCTEPGKKTCVCEYCQDEYTESIPAAGHKIVADAAVAPTCAAKGKTEGSHCTVCNAVVKKQEELPSAGHSFGEWKQTSSATVFEQGTQTRVCKNCDAKETKNTPKLKAVIELNANKIPLQVKQSTTGVKVISMTEGDEEVSWKSSNKKVAVVTSKGKITGKKVGTAKITVTLKSGISASVTVKVQKKAVTTTKLTITANSMKKNKLTLKKGKSATLTAVRMPITSTEKITYKSSNKKIAAVSQKGKITAKKLGKAKITVKSGKKKVVITVTVKK